MKSEQQTSFKDRLSQDVANQSSPSNDGHHINRDSANTTSIMFMTENENRSFTYSYLQDVGLNKKTGDIDVNFTNGTVVIKGKDLNKLFIDLHRHKATDVNIDNEDIDDIQITRHRD